MFQSNEFVEDDSREVVRVAMPGPDGATGIFAFWNSEVIPWYPSRID